MGLIRFLLAISIIFGHIPISNKLFLGAPMALHLFFMISGYSISYVLKTKYLKTKNGIRSYLVSRFIRIYPTYLIVLSMVIIYTVIVTFRGNTTNPIFYLNMYVHHITLFFTSCLTNLIILGQDVFMFMSYDPGTQHFFWTNNFILEPFRLDRFLFIPQAWALALELYFYLLAPWLVRKSTKYLFLLLFCSLLFRVVFTVFGYSFDPWAYRFFPAELFFFLLGILSHKNELFLRQWYGRLHIGLFFFPLCVFIIFFRSLPYIEFQGYQLFEWIFYPIFFFFMPYLFDQLQLNKLNILLGALSYPMYLTHLLVAALVLKIRIVDHYYGLTTIVGTVILSYLLQRYTASTMKLLKTRILMLIRKH